MRKIYLNNTLAQFLKTPTSSCYMIKYDMTIIPGGTATGVSLSDYSFANDMILKKELLTNHIATKEELAYAAITNISGTTTGTVILDVADLAARGNQALIVHKKQNGTWETLYNDEIPENLQITITLTEFSPLISIPKTIGEEIYLIDSNDSYIIDINDNYLIVTDA